MPSTALSVVGRVGIQGRGWNRRRREFDLTLGAGSWSLGHVWGSGLLQFTDAAKICEDAYVEFLLPQPDRTTAYCNLASDVYANARSNVRSGGDYSLQERNREHVHDIAIRNALHRLGYEFRGELVLPAVEGRSALGVLDWRCVPFHLPKEIIEPQLRGPWQPDSIAAFWYSNRVVLKTGTIQ
jgi:hypothetical protein